MKIVEIRPYAKKIDLVAKAIHINEPREVASRLDGMNHRVTEALMADDSASILLTLWDTAIDQVQKDKTYAIQNAYASFFKSSIRLNLGRFGKIAESPTPLESVNENNNLSEKELPTNRLGVES